MNFVEICIVCLIGLIGIFEIGHLTGVFLNCTLSDCGLIVMILFGIELFFSVGIFLRCRKKIELSEKAFNMKQCLPCLFFFLLLMLQIYIICSSPMLQAAGDITLETVNSFLVTDRIYEVSPLTGKVFGGVPLRYEIICLPTIYALLCKWTDLNPELVIGRIIPIAVLCFTYMVYGLLGEVLFKNESESCEKKWWFLLMTAVVFLFAEESIFMDGYGILHAGHMGTTIRNCVLIPLTIYAVLSKKYYLAFLCMLAEVCIVWTLWGMGMCLLIFAGGLLIRLLERNKRLCRIFPVFQKEGEAE